MPRCIAALKNGAAFRCPSFAQPDLIRTIESLNTVTGNLVNVIKNRWLYLHALQSGRQ